MAFVIKGSLSRTSMIVGRIQENSRNYFLRPRLTNSNGGFALRRKYHGCDFLTQFGILPVYTRFREKHIRLVQGDLLEQDVDQYVFSSFEGGYWPTPTSLWGAAKMRYFGINEPSDPDHLWGAPSRVGDTSVVTFNTMESFSQDFPLISLNMIGADVSYNVYGSNFEYSLRKSLFSLLFACRELSSADKLGTRVGIPLIGTGNQGLPIPTVSKLLKEFAEDALSTIKTLEEIVICAHSEDDAISLRGEFKLLSNQTPLLEISTLPEWQQDSIRSLIREIDKSKQILPTEICNALSDVLVRFEQEPLDKEGIAITSRSFLIEALGASKNENRLMNKIEELHSIGTPNIWISHMHMIRIIGNTAGHPNDAVRRVNPEDLVSILMGLQEVISAWPRIKKWREES